jgi:hypothetical protein
MNMRAFLLAAAILTLAACAGANTKPQIVATKPVPINLTQRVYVQIDPQLTAALAVPEGPLSACPDVARARRKVIEILNGRLLEISKVQASQVPPGK